MNREESWSENAWTAARHIYDKIIIHPFVRELSAGTLPVEKFEYYLQQDALYLDQYSPALSHIASRIPDKNHMETFIGFARDGIMVEQAMHREFLKKLPVREPEMSPACLLYTSVIRSLRSAPVEVEAAAVLPCFWIYQKVGQDIAANQSNPEENPYRQWIGTYSDETFVESTKKAIAICDDLAKNTSDKVRQMMTEKFVLCSKMEWMFWDSAYSLEKWKI